MSQIRLYFEGDWKLRRGFRQFFKEIDPKRLQLIDCGGTPVEDFRDALKTHPGDVVLLLKDSDVPYHDRLFDDLKLPPNLRESVFWMVQLMEAWFLPDPDALEVYYGNGFHRGALKKNPKVEEIPKDDVLSSLKKATEDTAKGAYHKTKHAPHLLERIDAAKVKDAAPNCRRLLDKLESC